ncbi:hypothetical protein [Massilia sp. CF038]|uniref:hypothetical protein n=1 Tax=Massilia sp. CF038 TaxID=1881045 RepID=UPI000932AE46|nr:hypothetical protein [Massilia sp. CF038]
MHFEVPKSKHLKEFAGEYLMIVISILTALALEHGAQSLHHHTLAQQASQKIDAEIRANTEELDKVIKHNDQRAEELLVIQKALLADIKAGTMDDETLMKHIVDKYDGAFSLSIHTPTLRREAWEVAVANQSVSWMNSSELKRYSAVYALMRDIQSLSGTGAAMFIDRPYLINVMSNVQMGVSNPREVYRMLNQEITSYRSANTNLRDLQKELAKATPAAH